MDSAERDEAGTVTTRIVAIDALPRMGPLQFGVDAIERELRKCYSGFQPYGADETDDGATPRPVATGEFVVAVLQWCGGVVCRGGMVVWCLFSPQWFNSRRRRQLGMRRLWWRPPS